MKSVVTFTFAEAKPYLSIFVRHWGDSTKKSNFIGGFNKLRMLESCYHFRGEDFWKIFQLFKKGGGRGGWVPEQNQHK